MEQYKLTKPVILVCLMQNAMFQQKRGLPENNRALVKNVVYLIQEAHKKKIPVIFTKQGNGFGGFKIGEKSWELIPEIQVCDSDKIIDVNNIYNHLEEEKVYSGIKELDARELIVVGMQSEFVVMNSCLSAIDLGYKVYLLNDAHSTFNKLIVMKGKNIMRRCEKKVMKKGGHVISTQEMINVFEGYNV